VNRQGRPFPPSEDGIPAIDATLNAGQGGITLDRAGTLYIAEPFTHRIRKVTPDGMFSTVAGSGPLMGPGGFAGDGGPAIEAQLNRPSDVVVDRFDNMYILDAGNRRIRKVTPDGIIRTLVVVNSIPPFSQLAVDSAGNVYFADTAGNRIQRIAPDGAMTAVAGTGEPGFSGDGGPREAARLSGPWGVTIDPAGNLYIGDTGNHRVRKTTLR
jgi:DNA-binding beta-propeller fold protein YncE